MLLQKNKALQNYQGQQHQDLLSSIRNFLYLIPILFIVAACKDNYRSGLNPGDYAPPFTLKGLDNVNHKLEDYKGKTLLINFWATWCGPCIEEMPALQDLHSKLKDRNFEILAIGVDDDEDSLREFKDKYGLTFPVLIDQDGLIKSKYKLTGVPETFILDKEGRLVMIPDLSNNIPVVRIVGPRVWNSPNAIRRIAEILTN